MACSDPLSPYTFDRSPNEPTETFTTQKRFAQRLRGVLRRINGAIRRGVKEDDIFNLSEDTDTLEVDDPGPFETDDSARMTARFMMWLREQLQTEFLDVVGPDQNQFIRKAYLAGLRNANGQLRDLDVAFTPDGATSVIERPIHISALRELFTRTYEQLESVASDVAESVRDELLDGFKQGQGPDKIARRLTDRVDSIGKHRATMIARSEVINAHSTATLTRSQELNDDQELGITVSHEWDAALDSRTCAFCRALDGVQFTPEEMEANRATVTSNLPDAFVGREFGLKPPAHPNGRCNIRMQVGTEIERPINQRLPSGIKV